MNCCIQAELQLLLHKLTLRSTLLIEVEENHEGAGNIVHGLTGKRGKHPFPGVH
jgi:hypothetical protein